MTKHSIKDLSIQVKLNGLSFCVLDKSSNTIAHISSLDFNNKRSPNDVLNQLKEELSTNTIFSDDFNSVQLIHFNELSTLVPKALYNEAHHADYLKFNSKILKTDFIASDFLNTQDIVNIYVPYMNLNNYIFDTFGAFTYKHASTIYIDAISEISSDDNNTLIYINVEKNAMLLVVFVNGKLNLYNFFEFTTPEDFIYYILFTVEQLQLDPETLRLYFTGIIEEQDAYYNIAYKYIRHVDFVSQNKLQKSTPKGAKPYKDYILKCSF